MLWWWAVSEQLRAYGPLGVALLLGGAWAIAAMITVGESTRWTRVLGALFLASIAGVAWDLTHWPITPPG